MKDKLNIDFNKAGGIIPAIIQDIHTRKVLMLGYMNQEALDKTLSEDKVTFYSRSKQRLWTKGETSGNYLFWKEIKVDCDNDTLLIQVEPVGPACHTGADTCFDEENKAPEGSKLLFLHKLGKVIKDRRENPLEGSYTNLLFEKGINKIAQKVGEEAVELVIESKDENKELFLNEAADLMYHLLVLLEAKGQSLTEVVEVLEKRHR